MKTSQAPRADNPLVRRIDDIQRRTGLHGRDVAELLGTSPQTVSRWRSGKVEPHRGTLNRLLTLSWLAERLEELYEPAEARLWLFSPHKLLGGDRPAERIEDGRIEDVLALIDQLRNGAYV